MAALELVVQQPPSAGIHLGLPAGPIALAKSQCASLGLLLLVLDAGGIKKSTMLATALVLAVFVLATAVVAAAILGVYPNAPDDFRTEVVVLFWVRAIGHGMLVMCLLGVLWRFWHFESRA